MILTMIWRYLVCCGINNDMEVFSMFVILTVIWKYLVCCDINNDMEFFSMLWY